MTTKNRIEIRPSNLFMERLHQYMRDNGITSEAIAVAGLASAGLIAQGYIVKAEAIKVVETHGGKRQGAGRKAKTNQTAHS